MSRVRRFLRDRRLLAFCLPPIAFAASYAILLLSFDRFVLPVYPIVLVIGFVGPLSAWRAWAERGVHTGPLPDAPTEQAQGEGA